MCQKRVFIKSICWWHSKPVCCQNKRGCYKQHPKRDKQWDYFSSNDLCNNTDKAALLDNSEGKGQTKSLKIWVEKLVFKKSEKLLGLNIASDFNWKTHCEKLASQLNQRVGMLGRMRFRLPVDKLLMVAEAIFNSKIRYGCSVYLQPIFEKEDLKARKITPETKNYK